MGSVGIFDWSTDVLGLISGYTVEGLSDRCSSQDAWVVAALNL